MKYLTLFFLPFLLVGNVYGVDYITSTVETHSESKALDCNDIEGDGILCRTYFNGETYIFCPDNTRAYIQEIKLDIEPDNTVTLLDVKNLYYDMESGLKIAGKPIAACGFKDKVYLFTSPEGDIPGPIRVSYKTPYSAIPEDSRWNMDHSYILGWNTNVPAAAIAYNNSMYLFIMHYKEAEKKYTLGITKTEDGETWDSSTWTFDDIGDDMNPDGNFSVCKIRNKEGQTRFLLAYTSKDSEIKTVHINPDGLVYAFKTSYKDDELLKIGALQGSVKGGSTGNIVQIVYTTKKSGGLYDNQIYFRKVEYDVQNERFTDYVEFRQNKNKISQSTWQPLVFSDYLEDGNGHLYKKFAVAFPRLECDDKLFGNRNLSQYLDIMTWSSEKFEYQPSADMYDSETDSSLWTLVGVIEGAPPYVLNGWILTDDLNDPNRLPPDKRPFASLTYGVFQSHSDSREFNFSCSNETEMNVAGFLFGGGSFFKKTSKDSREKNVSVSFSIEPHIDALGYWIVMKPTIYRKKYNILDAAGNFIDEYYVFKVSDNHLKLISFDDLTARSRLNPHDIDSYINRSYPLNNYNSVFKHAFSAERGSSERVRMEVTETESSSVSKGFNLEVGYEGDVIPEIFKVKTVNKFEWEWKTEITQTSGQSVDIFTKFVERNHNVETTTDTIGYEGGFYWLLPTDGLDNWWIPQNSVFSNDLPWCMTWQVTGLDVKEVTKITAGIDYNPYVTRMSVYPNPAGSFAVINFVAEYSADIIITVYNSQGNIVNDLIIDDARIGENTVKLNTANLPQGIYQCVVRIGTDIYSSKFAVVK